MYAMEQVLIDMSHKRILRVGGRLETSGMASLIVGGYSGREGLLKIARRD